MLEAANIDNTAVNVLADLPDVDRIKDKTFYDNQLPEPIDINALSYDERLDRLEKTVKRQSLHRELLLKILAYCQEQRTLAELEDYIASLPWFKESTQPQYYLIQFLVDGAGLVELDLDAGGQIIEPSQKANLDEDELDDLIATWAYIITDEGRAILEEMSVQNRLVALFDELPQFKAILLEVLNFLETKQQFAAVDTLLRGRDLSALGEAVQPSVFVDKLEKAGAVYWQDGWQSTKEGREAATSFNSQ
jgi:hypothetical protein